MSSLRLVRFEDPSDFVDSLRDYDTSAMNFCLGSLLDFINDSQDKPKAIQDSGARILLAVYKENELIVTLTNVGPGSVWIMSMPDIDDSICSSADVTDAAALLAQSLSTTIDPEILRQVAGPEAAVDTLLDTWISVVETSRGIRLKKLGPSFKSQYCYATLATLPPLASSPIAASPTVSPPSGAISQAQPDDVDLLIPLLMGLSAHSPAPTPSTEEARQRISSAIRRRNVWTYRLTGTSDSQVIVGYVLLGRATPNTIAIRNVFVVPSHRRQGIAEGLVRTVTRYYLGAQLSGGFEGVRVPETAPEGGFRKQICLNVSDPGAVRIYKRCGFMLDDDAKDPETGQLGWSIRIWAAVERLDKESLA